MKRDEKQVYRDSQPAQQAWLDGKSIQYKHLVNDGWSDWIEFDMPGMPGFLNENNQWRVKPLEFPAPPPSECFHNPDNLTPEQVGEGYRLLLASEIKDRDWNEDIHKWDGSKWSETRWRGSHKGFTFRVPSSTPFHWDAPKRVPLAPKDFIGAWLKFSASSHWQVAGIEGDKIHTKRGVYTADELISREVTVRLANTTEFVPCYREGAV